MEAATSSEECSMLSIQLTLAFWFAVDTEGGGRVYVYFGQL